MVPVSAQGGSGPGGSGPGGNVVSLRVVRADVNQPSPRPGDTAATDPALDLVLDNPAWASLTGAHAHLGEGNDLARRFRSDVSPFSAVRDWSDPDVWAAILDLVGYDADFLAAPHEDVPVPAGWAHGNTLHGVQLVETAQVAARPDEEAVVLGAADVPEMIDLVERAQPGPFLTRTHELGRYVGLRRDGRLVAMAGERLRPGGWVELSAVATDERYRGQGLASRLALDVVHHAREHGERTFLHATADNTTAIRLYEHLGFALRRGVTFGSVRTPAAP